ncbi:FHA domain-containing protein [Phormidesmis sp. 146-35]
MITLKIFDHQTGESQEKIFTSKALAQGGGLIGRNAKCDLMLNSSDVSRVHARIFNQAGQYYFSDLGSTSGSMVNEEDAQTNQNFPLKLNDTIRIGDFVLTVTAAKSSNGASNSIVAFTRTSARFLAVVGVLTSLVAIAYLYLPVDSLSLDQLFHP